jgi:hypothetical protein
MLNRYYSLDECSDRSVVIDRLDEMQNDGKIYFSIVESDIVKIVDGGLTVKEMKDLVSFFDVNDVIEYMDYEDLYGDEDDDLDDEYEDDEYEDDF